MGINWTLSFTPTTLTCKIIFCECDSGSIFAIGFLTTAAADGATFSAPILSFLAAASTAFSLVNDLRVKLLSSRRMVEPIGAFVFAGLFGRAAGTDVSLALCNVAVAPMRVRVRRGAAAAVVPVVALAAPAFVVARNELLRVSVFRNGTAPLQCVSTRGFTFFISIIAAIGSTATLEIPIWIREFTIDNCTWRMGFFHEKLPCLLEAGRIHIAGGPIHQITQSGPLDASHAQLDFAGAEFRGKHSLLNGILFNENRKKIIIPLNNHRKMLKTSLYY